MVVLDLLDLGNLVALRVDPRLELVISLFDFCLYPELLQPLVLLLLDPIDSFVDGNLAKLILVHASFVGVWLEAALLHELHLLFSL